MNGKNYGLIIIGVTSLLLGLTTSCSTEENIRHTKFHAPQGEDATPEEQNSEEEEQNNQEEEENNQEEEQNNEEEEQNTKEEEIPLREVTPGLGVKNYEQLFLTMSVVTGVDPMNNNVRTAYEDLSTGLPETNDARAFTAQQGNISKLALEFCDVMMNDPGLRSAPLPNFDFTSNPSAAFDQAGAEYFVDSLAARFWGRPLADFPEGAEVRTMTVELINEIIATKADTPQFTVNTAKGVCSALLASTHVTLL